VLAWDVEIWVACCSFGRVWRGVPECGRCSDGFCRWWVLGRCVDEVPVRAAADAFGRGFYPGVGLLVAFPARTVCLTVQSLSGGWPGSVYAHIEVVSGCGVALCWGDSLGVLGRVVGGWWAWVEGGVKGPWVSGVCMLLSVGANWGVVAVGGGLLVLEDWGQSFWPGMFFARCAGSRRLCVDGLG